MDINKIYFYINEVLNSYLYEGIKPDHLLTFLNTDKDNYKFIYNRVYRQLNVKNIQFESAILEDCLKDSIRDKVALINDLKNNK